MSLQIDTLVTNKSTFNPSDKQNLENYGIWDLTKPSISYQGVSPEYKTFMVVPEYFQMRPDLVSTLRMGTQNQMGVLLKFNSISNPFALKEGQILAVPDSRTVNDAFTARKILNQKASSDNSNFNPNQEFRKNQEQKKFQISEGRKKFLDDKVKNNPGMILPPNVAQPGETSITKQKGYLVLAPSAGGGGFNLPTNS
jgi:hypothetical protein